MLKYLPPARAEISRPDSLLAGIVDACVGRVEDHG
ncbi:hypothetical protein SAMN05216604_11016 [Pseudomonas agarici]|nr:hypothetical protein SAMN05216604_11016 [Pseudomonas agarici]